MKTEETVNVQEEATEKAESSQSELSERLDAEQDEDICGLCGEPGADKYAHPCHWPGEQIPDNPLVHSECEQEECKRAHREFMNRVGENGVRDFLRGI